MASSTTITSAAAHSEPTIRAPALLHPTDFCLNPILPRRIQHADGPIHSMGPPPYFVAIEFTPPGGCAALPRGPTLLPGARRLVAGRDGLRRQTSEAGEHQFRLQREAALGALLRHGAVVDGRLALLVGRAGRDVDRLG